MGSRHILENSTPPGRGISGDPPAGKDEKEKMRQKEEEVEGKVINVTYMQNH